jgi:hypothetical protein
MVSSVATEKIPSVTPPGIDPETVRLVAQCLNQYTTPGPFNYYNDNANTTTFIINTILFLQRFATCFGQYGHQQAQLLQKYTREDRNIERGPSPKLLLTRQRMPETEILNLWDRTQQKLYTVNPCVLNFHLTLKHDIESLMMVC